MSFDTIIRNGSVVTATDTFVADVAISDGKISAIGSNLPAENASHVIDATGKLVRDYKCGRFRNGHARGCLWRDDDAD